VVITICEQAVLAVFFAGALPLFDLHRWASQALGLKGLLLGWAPPVRRAIRRRAARGLEAFIAARGLTEATA